MSISYLSPDSYLPNDPQPDDLMSLYRQRDPYRRPPRPPQGGRLMAGGQGNGMAGANTAVTRGVYGSINNSALSNAQVGPTTYQTPTPEEYIGIYPTNSPDASPNRGGFNQAEGLVGPDYSEGDALRKKATELQNPSLWKKLVNGDEGLNIQSEHKQRLAQYADLAAERKHRWQHPELYKDQTKYEHVQGGLWDPTNKDWAVQPPKTEYAPEDVQTVQEGGKLWGRRKSSTNLEPIMKPRPNTQGPTPSGAGFTGEEQANANEKEFAPKGYQTSYFKGEDGKTYAAVADPDSGGRPRVYPVEDLPAGATKAGAKGATAGKPDWNPKDLEKAAGRIASMRRTAEASSDPVEIKKTEDRIVAMLNSGGLAEDPLTGTLSVRASGAEKPTVGDVRPGDMIRGTAGRKTPIPEGTVIEKGGKQYKKLRGKWVEYTGTK